LIASNCGRGIRAPTNPFRGLGLRDIDGMILGAAGRGALSAPAISKQGFPELCQPIEIPKKTAAFSNAAVFECKTEKIKPPPADADKANNTSPSS
jgi:hypothetical protein